MIDPGVRCGGFTCPEPTPHLTGATSKCYTKWHGVRRPHGLCQQRKSPQHCPNRTGSTAEISEPFWTHTSNLIKPSYQVCVLKNAEPDLVNEYKWGVCMVLESVWIILAWWGDTEDPGVTVEPPAEEPPVFGGRLSQTSWSGSNFYYPLTCWASRPKLSKARRGQNAETIRSAIATKPDSQASYCIFNPTGHFRNLWDFIGIGLLILDTMILPVQFVNEDFYSLYPSLAVNSRIAAFYWLTDIVLSFSTGYLKTLAQMKSVTLAKHEPNISKNMSQIHENILYYNEYYSWLIS